MPCGDCQASVGGACTSVSPHQCTALPRRTSRLTQCSRSAWRARLSTGRGEAASGFGGISSAAGQGWVKQQSGRVGGRSGWACVHACLPRWQRLQRGQARGTGTAGTRRGRNNGTWEAKHLLPVVFLQARSPGKACTGQGMGVILACRRRCELEPQVVLTSFMHLHTLMHCPCCQPGIQSCSWPLPPRCVWHHPAPANAARAHSCQQLRAGQAGQQ